MLPRYLPPVSSPTCFRALTRAAVEAARPENGSSASGAASDRVATALRERYGATAVALTDSGTSALVIALRAMVPEGGTVALPAYGCVDLIAAAIRAGVRVRLYDVDPRSLGPDLDSMRRTLARGADAVVATHLYGYPVDMEVVLGLAHAAGARVIEDAAQHAGARMNGAPVGSSGPVTVLSFGRGKGTSGGRGGALFATRSADSSVASAIASWERVGVRADSNGIAHAPSAASAGWSDLGRAAAQWAFGRPPLYVIPASIPALELGQTAYRPAGEPERLSHAAAALVEVALARVDADRATRAARAAWYTERLADIAALDLVDPIAGAEPGYLRFPVLARLAADAKRIPAPPLGVVRTYPLPLGEEPAAAAVMHLREPTMPGAREICSRLFTLPTHAAVTDADAERVLGWARGA
jgi:perosamine synthetase